MAYEYTRESSLYESDCYLITKTHSIDVNGIVKDEELIKKQVFCLVGSLYSKETYAAYSAGIKPAWRIVVPSCDYNDEPLVEYDGKTYEVYRTFLNGENVELYTRKDLGEWGSGLN